MSRAVRFADWRGAWGVGYLEHLSSSAVRRFCVQDEAHVVVFPAACELQGELNPALACLLFPLKCFLFLFRALAVVDTASL